MSHFAKVLDGKVVQIISAEPEFFTTFVDSSPGNWIQTSYNTRGGAHYLSDGVTLSNTQGKALRKNYAGLGFTYDQLRDAFIPPQPYPSWVLNEDTCLWDPPSPYPTDGALYKWNEEWKTWAKNTAGLNK